MSNDQEKDLFIDFERDILGPNRTPPLKATKPNFKSLDSPPPLVPYCPSDSTDAEEAKGTSAKRSCRFRKSRTHATSADGVLICDIDPNRTTNGGKNALASASQSEAEEEDNEAEYVTLYMRDHHRRGYQHAESNAPSQTKDYAVATLDVMNDKEDKSERAAGDNREGCTIDEKPLQLSSNIGPDVSKAGRTLQDRPPTPPRPRSR